ncbi:MAG: hypothetical protein KGL45_15260 [Gammaproteobacteria bacterium]|nr:hypothetical protein [Gammaproteobacteria bacterium]MDE2263880.1 hypothetical protein [Gammaproteobacteria bacterium]
MIRSRNTSAVCAAPPTGIRRRARRLMLLYLARPRLISNLLALVALFSIGFV